MKSTTQDQQKEKMSKAHSQISSIIGVLRPLPFLLLQALDVKAGRMRRLDHIIKKLKRLSLKRRCLVEKLPQQLISFLRGEKVVNYRTGGMMGNVLRCVQMQSLAFLSQSPSFRR